MGKGSRLLAYRGTWMGREGGTPFIWLTGRDGSPRFLAGTGRDEDHGKVKNRSGTWSGNRSGT